MLRPIIEFKNVGQRFGDRQVFENINLKLDFDTSPIIIIMGQSGAGKTTLATMVGGVPPDGASYPTSGVVEFDGTPVNGQHNDVVTVFQGRVNLPHLTVRENVELPFKLKFWKDKKGDVDGILAAVGLTESQHLLPHQLSGGMQQRLQLARAFVVQPRVLLADEPFSALDPTTRAGMHKLLLDLCQNTNTSVVFITHDVTEAVTLGSRVLVLGSKGRGIIGDFNLSTPHAERGRDWRQSYSARTVGEALHGLLEEM
jgi:ABC-type nitrate/sulfonate/bicarbonate transport system ATPase subunit